MSNFPVCEIQSVALGVPDIDVAKRFYTAAWGLEFTEKRDEVVYLRAEGNEPYVLALYPRAEPVVLWTTFGVASHSELARIADATEKSTGKVISPTAENGGPEGGAALTVRTSEGYVFRFLHGAAKCGKGAKRRAHPLRLSHINLNCADIESTRRYFESVLGFSMTDRSKAMAFLSCNQDHHTVVLADSGVDGMNHIAFMMSDFDSLVRAAGGMIDHGYPIGWGVGRHGPGDNIFTYFVDPFGIVIEYTCDVLQVDDSYAPRGPEHWKWPPGRTDQWGIAPPKSEAVKRAQLSIRFARQ